MNSSTLAKFYDLPIDQTDDALRNIDKKSVSFLCASGKLGSGKDTVAPKVIDRLGFSSELADHNFFAKPLKDEINDVISIIRNSEVWQDAVNNISLQLRASKVGSETAVDSLWKEVKSGAVKSSYDRTDSTRFTLQFWGTEVRRAEDVNYWVKRSVAPAIQELSNNKSVFFTDARFPNEIDAINALNGLSIRLLVSPEVQSQRIMARDGVTISEATRNHASEIALDDYKNFTSIVDTDFLTPDGVVEEALKDILRKTSYTLKDRL